MGDAEGRSYRRACDVLGVQARQVVLATLRGSTPSTLTLHDVSEAEVTALLHLLTDTKSISGLQLVQCRLSAATWKQLAHAVIGNQSLVSLSFVSCDGVGKDEVVQTLSKRTKGSHRSSLRDVCLSDCGLRLAGLEALIDGLVCLPQLPHGTVDLSRNALPQQAGILLGKLIRSVNGPRTLNLSHNELGDCGAAAIGGGLAADLRKLGPEFGRLNLTQLNLSYNGIGDEGLAKLCTGVRAYMAREVSVAAGKAMARPMCPIKELLLAGNRITDTGASSCIAMLMSGKANEPGLRLRQLDVGYNSLGDAGIAVVCEAIEQAGAHCAIESLDLRGVGLGTVGLKAVTAAVAANGAIRQISVSLPPLEQDRDLQATLDSLQHLADSIERSTSLTEVTLEGLSRYVEYAPSVVGSVLMRVDRALAINRARAHGDVQKLGSPPQTPKHTPQQTMTPREHVASLAAPVPSSPPHVSPSSPQPPCSLSPRTRPHGSPTTPRLASSSSPKRSSYTRPAPRRQPSLKRARSGGRAAGGGGDGVRSGGGGDGGVQGERRRGEAVATGGEGDGDAEANAQKPGLMVGKVRVGFGGGEMPGEWEGAKRVGAPRPLPPTLVIPEGDRLGLGVFRMSFAEAAVGGYLRTDHDRRDGGTGNVAGPWQDGPLQQPEQAGPVSGGEADGLVAVSTDPKETPGRALAPTQLEQEVQPPRSDAADSCSGNPSSGCHGEPVESPFTAPGGTAAPTHARSNLIRAPFGAVVEAQEPQLQYTEQAVAANDDDLPREEPVHTPESALASCVALDLHAGGHVSWGHSQPPGPQPELVPEVPTASAVDGSAGSTVHVSTHMGRCRSSPSVGGTAAGRALQAENMGGRSDRMNVRSPGGGRTSDALLDVRKPSRAWERCDQQQELARSPRHWVLPNVNTGNVGALKASPGGVSRSRRLIVPTPLDSGITKTKVMAELREGLGGQSDDVQYVLVVSNSNSPRGAADPAELSDDEEVSRVLGQCQDEHDDQLDAEPVVETAEVDPPTIEVADAGGFEPRDDLASVSSSSLELSPSSASSTSSSLSLSSSQTPEMVAVAERSVSPAQRLPSVPPSSTSMWQPQGADAVAADDRTMLFNLVMHGSRRGTSRRISSVAVMAQVTGAPEGWGPADVRSSLLVGGKGPPQREEKADAPVSVELPRRLTQVQGQAAEAVVCVEEPSLSASTRRDSQQHRRTSRASVRGVSLSSPSLKSSAVDTLQAVIESEADAALQAFGAALSSSRGANAQRTRGSLSRESPRRVSCFSVPEDRMPQPRSTPPRRIAQGAEQAQSRLSYDITTYPFEAIQADTADPSPSTARNVSSRVHHHHPAAHSTAKLRSQRTESRDVVRKGRHQERAHELQRVHQQLAVDEERSGGRGRGVRPRVRPYRETDLLEKGADGPRRSKKWREIEAVLQRIMQLGPVLSDTRYETLLHRVNNLEEMLVAMTTEQTQRACKERSHLKKVRRRVMELESRAGALVPHGRTDVRRQFHREVSAGTDAQPSSVDSRIRYQVPPLELMLLAQEQDTVMVLERIMTLIDSLREHECNGVVRAEV